MESGLNNLSNLFKSGIYKIPDYQRGYAWGTKEIEDFWEDLYNLSAERSHYGGVITLEPIPEYELNKNDIDSWFLSKINKTPYYVVDGQQRLTTAMILLKVILEVARSKSLTILNEFDSISEIEKDFIVLKREADGAFYLPFSYEVENDSYGFYISKILGLNSFENKFPIYENKYSDNLQIAYDFFKERVSKLEQTGIDSLYTKLVHKLVFNRYVIDSSLDIHVTFETMNNRGRVLSTLELLKNRLIYLTTLYTQVSRHERNNVKDQINDAWKRMYRSIGEIEHSKNSFDWNDRRYRFSSQTTDDIFLDAQLTAYPINKFKNFLGSKEQLNYEKNTSILQAGNLLKDIFTSQNVIQNKLKLRDIQDYIEDLKVSIIVWKNMQLTLNSPYDIKTKEYLSRINFLTRSNRHYNRRKEFVIPKEIFNGIFEANSIEELSKNLTYDKETHSFYDTQSIQDSVQKFIFKLLKVASGNMLQILKNIERFLFLDSFVPETDEIKYEELNKGKGNLQYEVFILLCYIDRQPEITEELLGKFNERLVRIGKEYLKLLAKSYDILSESQSYINYSKLSYYILTQYNLELMDISKENFNEFERLSFYFEKQKYNLEHIYPRNHRYKYWKERFGNLNQKNSDRYKNTLGNLIVISARKNEKLENKSYPEKCDFGTTNNPTGYKYGTMAEKYLAEHYSDWTQEAIFKRGKEILTFMHKEWGIKVSQKDSRRVLGLPENKSQY
ncbi:GmrSD restriction endonuclease domain-containing protein [Streptococcus sp. S784/96/1]|uniref:GmrSD restriction endonuclease domain-containing protein n=1 Tax=Streptococcus sp. S784/96/1 TaxID=2653499 RepID=UPI0013896AE9|nr:DUF262 domain-containing protein [Streptococcus sp. S784/96/1]